MILSLMMFPAHAEVVVNYLCMPKANCDVTKNPDIANLFQNKKFRDLRVMRFHFEMLLQHEAVQAFDYKQNEIDKVDCRITLKKQIKRSILDTNLPSFSLVESRIFGRELPIYIGNDDVEKITKRVSQELLRQGYVDSKISVLLGEDDQIKLSILVGPALKIVGVELEGIDSSFEKSLFREALKMKGQTYNTDEWKNAIDVVVGNFSSAGYFGTEIDYKVRIDRTNVSIVITLKKARRLFYQITGNNSISLADLKQEINQSARAKSAADSETIISSILSLYKAKAFHDAAVKVTEQTGNLGEDEKGVYYFAQVIEGKRSYVDEVVFLDASPEVIKIINDYYDKNATSLAKGGFFDKEFFLQLPDLLKNELARHGYLSANVSTPILSELSSHHFKIQYNVSSGLQVQIRNIEIEMDNDNPALLDKLHLMLQSMKGEAINLDTVDSKMDELEEFLDDQGYILAKIKNKKINEMFLRTEDDRYFNLRIQIELRDRAFFDTAQIYGLEKTKAEVILREITVKHGDLLTNKTLKEINEKIINLGLFSYVRIAPLAKEIHPGGPGKWTDIILQLKERDYGVVSVAPGYRTDLGYKIKTTVTLNNIEGMNKSLSVSAQGNRRTSLSNLDDRRRQNGHQFIEYQGAIIYTLPRFWGTYFKLDQSINFNKTRYFSFDAEILKLSLNLSRDFGRYWSFALLYQVESISQSDASSDKDAGYFRIGGFTPSITFDIRDSYVNPKKGFSSSLSLEHAAPYFYSMSNQDIEINFLKTILRNRAYLTLGGVTFALYLAGGVERNLQQDPVMIDGTPKLDSSGLATPRGYIPSIKVFRLDGLDIVRGFRDNEINALSNGEDVTRRPVTNSAYFMIMKFEPRLMIAENIMWNVFYDAGRVFVDSFEFSELRSSYGTGIKFVTPVGTIDFDYGIKTERKRLSGNQVESFGRFHLSIGVF